MNCRKGGIVIVRFHVFNISRFPYFMLNARFPREIYFLVHD